jgi:hypothetical protein
LDAFLHFEGLSALEVTYVGSNVRLYLWSAHFATMPDTAFGAQWQRHLATAHLDNRREKPN